ncbi:hypothetical protein HDU76_010745, partial [Blyttiomyces sp. JEL0837]
IPDTEPTKPKSLKKPAALHKYFSTPVIFLLAIPLTLLASTILFTISFVNYPGGVALHQSPNAIQLTDVEDGFPYIHYDSYVASNGASLFMQTESHNQWTYSKNETHLTPEDYLNAGYSHLLTSTPELFNPVAKNVKDADVVAMLSGQKWKSLGAVSGFDGIVWREEGIYWWVEEVGKLVMKGNVRWKPMFWTFGVPLPFKVKMSPK